MPSGAKAQQAYRQKTGYNYDKAYKKARQRALNRLAKEHSGDFRRIFDEERAAEGLNPLRGDASA